MNDYEDMLIAALDMVAAWELPEEDLADAVNAQARLMAGSNIEASNDIPVTNPYDALRF